MEKYRTIFSEASDFDLMSKVIACHLWEDGIKDENEICCMTEDMRHVESENKKRNFPLISNVVWDHIFRYIRDIRLGVLDPSKIKTRLANWPK